MVSTRLRNAAIAAFGLAPRGFDQIATLPARRTIITIWSNRYASYQRDRTLEPCRACAQPTAAGTSAWYEIAADTATFGWSSTLGTYQLALKDVGSGSLVFSFPDNNPVAFTLRLEGGSTVPLAVGVQPQINGAGYLWWSPSSGDRFSTGIAAFGLAAQASDIPTGGARNFVGEGLAEYAPTIDFDFDRGRLTGKVRVAWNDAWGPYPATTYDLTPASFDRSANTFAATLSVPGAPTLGSIHGMFMGPGAREVAIAWQSPIVDLYDLRWVTVRGVWLGHCTSCGN
jgi:hypothetical protein